MDEFVNNNAILLCNADTAKIYGDIKVKLKTKGRMLPENDIWISAIAEQYALILATRDAHFHQIVNLEVEIW
ncbi:MAG: PIN domain-containing protein [Planctomycetes bacterium]|nr:PIN domain-containing protein [Planctomycetota bacterium]